MSATATSTLFNGALSNTPLNLGATPWPLVPTWTIFQHVDKRSTTGTERLLSVSKTHGVIPRDQLTDRPARADTLVGYKKCQKGDLIINQMSIFDGLLGVSPCDGIVTYHYLVFRPSEQIDARLYAYLFRSNVYLEDFRARVRGLGGTDQANVRTPHIRIGDVGKTVVPFPPLVTQRAIADYLDTETARIDSLIEKKRRMVELLEERWESEVSAALWSGDFKQTRLKHLAGRPTSGNRDHSSFSPTENGVPCLRGLNVRPNRIDRANLLHISKEDHMRHRPTELRSGDLVIVRSGVAGSAVVIPEDLDRCNCVDLVIVRRSETLVPGYLENVINSRTAQEQVKQGSSGAILTHFNADDCAELVIPLRPMNEQRTIVAALDEAWANTAGLRTALDAQVSLLVERRQALITAAVTGDLDIPGVAA